MNDGNLRLAIFEVMNVVGGSREGIYGHSQRADFCGPKEGGHKFRRIRKDNQNTIAAGNALRKQRIPRAIGERGKFAITYFARFANDGGALRV